MSGTILQKVIFAAVLFTTFLCMGEELSYPVFPLKKAPAMNGEWSTGAWEDIPAATGLSQMKTGEFSQMRQTAFKMGWFENDLYISVRCNEPTPERIKTDANNYRDGWYPDDHLEFFFSKNNSSNKGFKQFVVNSRAGRWCNFTAHGKSDDWKAAALKGKDFWTVEIRIPFSLLDISSDFRTGKFWFNLARVANSNSEGDILTCFAPVMTSFNNVSRYASMTFKGSPSPDELAAVGKRLNRLEKWSHARLWKIANVREAFLTGIDESALKPFMELKQQAKKMLASKDMSNALQLINEYEKMAMDFSRPVKKVLLKVDKKNADVKIFFNGKELKPDATGKYSITFNEGFSVLAAECTAAGTYPGINFKLENCPETDCRWEYSKAAEKDWLEANSVNNGSWVPAVLKNGLIWSGDPQDKKIYMKQVILWNKGHDGPNRCINPLVRVWGFSRDSTEPMFLALYQPIKGMSEGYEFILDLPEGFRLLDMKHDESAGWWGPKVNMNCIPSQVIRTTVMHGSRKFTRNTIRFNAKDICKDKTLASILPVSLDKSRKVGEKDTFYFRRNLAGNFTELEQTLPVEVLPEINGRMPKEFMMFNYCAQPYFGAHVSDEVLKEFVNSASKAGFNTWIFQPDYKKDKHYFNLFRELLREKNARMFGHYYNFPAWKGSLGYTNMRSFVDKNPEAKARYFNGRPVPVGSSTYDFKSLKDDWNRTAMYCPTYVTTAGRDIFMGIVIEDLKKILRPFENDLYGYWINWESEPWQNGNAYLAAKSGLGSYCFCDKCKKGFYKSIGLPESANLSDEEIFRKYYNEWKNYRYSLDGKVQGLITEACRKMNMRYMVYSWVNQEKFWEACKGRIDLAFIGCPGNAPANAVNQDFLDKSMEFFRNKVGMNRVMGQRFSFFSTYYSIQENGWKQYTVMSADGYIDAKSWKNQVLRIAASLHGGLDFQSSLECIAGIMYYVGEASRAISQYEDLFLNGKREDDLAVSKEIKYPNLLVLTKGKERLVLLFNDGDKPLTVNLENRNLSPGQTAEIWEGTGKKTNPAKMLITIPAADTVLVHIK